MAAADRPIHAAPRALSVTPASDSTRPAFSLRRWSERKLAAARTAAPVATDATTVHVAAGEPPAPAEVAPDSGAPASAVTPPAPLPAVDSLTFDSDFTAFLKPEVDESMRRDALRKLFRDPHFNVMDGLDIYIDDYGKPDPIPPEIVRQLVQGRYLFDPPRTRVNERGEVEDVPPETDAAAVADAVPAAETGAAAAALPAPGDARFPASRPAAAAAVPVAAATVAQAAPVNLQGRDGDAGDAPRREDDR